MDGWMIAFQLPPGTPASRRVRFQHKLWGRRTTTWHGKYEHHEGGLLEGIPHHRLQRGIILLHKDDIKAVTAFLDGWNAVFHIRRVELNPDDHAAMDRPA